MLHRGREKSQPASSIDVAPSDVMRATHSPTSIATFPTRLPTPTVRGVRAIHGIQKRVGNTQLADRHDIRHGSESRRLQRVGDLQVGLAGQRACRGPPAYFAAGPQTIRIQVREDGFSIDQIVLSPTTYLNASPGSLKNDTTIPPKQNGSNP
jgi:hypothetical protein